MPETNGNEIPVSQTVQAHSERTEAKFFEDVEKIITEAERPGAAYDPLNKIAFVTKRKCFGKRLHQIKILETKNLSNL